MKNVFPLAPSCWGVAIGTAFTPFLWSCECFQASPQGGWCHHCCWMRSLSVSRGIFRRCWVNIPHPVGCIHSSCTLIMLSVAWLTRRVCSLCQKNNAVASVLLPKLGFLEITVPPVKLYYCHIIQNKNHLVCIHVWCLGFSVLAA